MNFQVYFQTAQGGSTPWLTVTSEQWAEIKRETGQTQDPDAPRYMGLYNGWNLYACPAEPHR